MRWSTISQYILKIMIQMLKSPIIIGLMLGLLVNVSAITLMPALDEPITLLSGAAVPLALFILGASLNKFKLTSQLHVF